MQFKKGGFPFNVLSYYNRVGFTTHSWGNFCGFIHFIVKHIMICMKQFATKQHNPTKLRDTLQKAKQLFISSNQSPKANT
jgi:hypothetical protein